MRDVLRVPRIINWTLVAIGAILAGPVVCHIWRWLDRVWPCSPFKP